MPVIPPSNYIPIWIPVSSPAEKIARAKEELKASGVAAEDSCKDETSVKDTDSNGKKIDESSNAMPGEQLQRDAAGLVPNTKKMTLSRTSSEDGNGNNGDVPKPKRERKRSKNKAKCVDGGNVEQTGNGENLVDEEGDSADAPLVAVELSGGLEVNAAVSNETVAKK